MNSLGEEKTNKQKHGCQHLISDIAKSQPYTAASWATLAAGLLQVHGLKEKPRSHAKSQLCFKWLGHILNAFHHHC